MRIMSYNLHSGKSMDNVFDMEAIADVIAELKPDICALNEVRMGTTDVGRMSMAPWLARKLDMEWRFGRTIYIAGGEYGIGMLSRFPIISSRVVPVPDLPQDERARRFEPRAVLECVIDTGKGKIRAVTSHFGLSLGERHNAVETVFGLIDEDEKLPTVFMGDLNAEPDEDTIAMLRERLNDTAGDTPLTFPARGTNIKIDYIFTDGFEKAELKTYETLASDHLPVYIDTDII